MKIVRNDARKTFFPDKSDPQFLIVFGFEFSVCPNLLLGFGRFNEFYFIFMHPFNHNAGVTIEEKEKDRRCFLFFPFACDLFRRMVSNCTNSCVRILIVRCDQGPERKSLSTRSPRWGLQVLLDHLHIDS